MKKLLLLCLLAHQPFNIRASASLQQNTSSPRNVKNNNFYTIAIPTNKKLAIAQKLRGKSDEIDVFGKMVMKTILHNKKNEALVAKSKYEESLLVTTLRETHLKNQIYKLKQEMITLQIIKDITENFRTTKKLIVPLYLLTEILEEAELQLILDTQKTLATESLCQIL
jgi:hypothetical protein